MTLKLGGQVGAPAPGGPRLGPEATLLPMGPGQASGFRASVSPSVAYGQS